MIFALKWAVIILLCIGVAMFAANQIARAAGRGWFHARWEMWNRFKKQKRG